MVAAMVPFTLLAENVQQVKNGMVVKVQGKAGKPTKSVRIQAWGDEVVRVTSTLNANFAKNKSLIVKEDALPTVAVTTKRLKDTVVLSTRALVVKVSTKDGGVAFFNTKGERIVAESKNGTSFKIAENAAPYKAYAMQQVFDSPANEAIYGLGQQQSDEFNYKGKNETLFQYNTKVSVPFIVSNKNYGILWDNYSLTRYGNPNDYSNIGMFKLYDSEGNAGALTASYYTKADLSKPIIKRSESKIDYENLEDIKQFPKDFQFVGAKITWEGKIEPQESGNFWFKLYYAGYTKVFLDGKEVVAERWRTAWNPNTYKFNMDLVKGKKYDLRIEWKPDGGISYIGFKALAPVDASQQAKVSFWSEFGRQIDYYFIKGSNIDGVIKGYRNLTGKAPIMPKWAMGFWQSRERYKSSKELVGVVSEYRKRNIPIDNIVLDWSYWPVDAWGSHEFDAKFFPDPKAMVDNLHELNAHIMISVWPKFYQTTEHFKEFDSKGWMYKQAIKDSVRDWIGSGYIGSFYDAYNPDARKLFWSQMRDHLFSKGFDAWWMDASEPDILSNSSLEYRKKLSTPTFLGSSTEYLNAYALVNAMAIYNGQMETAPEKRVFLLTRSGFAGLQKYSTAVWSGDIGTRWEDMKAQISAGLNFAMSGIPYWTMDIGGFCVEHRYEMAKEGSEDLDEWRELNTRWFQFGAFCPLFRVHGQYPYREIYNIAPEDHPAYKSMVYYDKLRYEMMPYIYTLASKAYFEDYTLMRALVMDYASDASVLNIADQYMFGPSVMVCPVYKYKARSREVYFPQGNGWFDLYTGKYTEGGTKEVVEAPYETMPLYVREGSIIPMGPAVSYALQSTDEPTKLVVYTGKDAKFSLYTDDGVSNSYKKGEYQSIPLTYNEATKSLTIGKCEGKMSAKAHKFTVVWVSKDSPKSIQTAADKQIEYTGNEIVVKMQ